MVTIRDMGIRLLYKMMKVRISGFGGQRKGLNAKKISAFNEGLCLVCRSVLLIEIPLFAGEDPLQRK